MLILPSIHFEDSSGVALRSTSQTFRVWLLSVCDILRVCIRNPGKHTVSFSRYLCSVSIPTLKDAYWRQKTRSF